MECVLGRERGGGVWGEKKEKSCGEKICVLGGQKLCVKGERVLTIAQ